MPRVPRKAARRQPARKPALSQRAARYINPAGLPQPRGYTQAVAVSGPAKTVYVGAQTAVDASGVLVGKGDIAAQTRKVMENIGLCLEAAGAKPEHIVLWRIYVVDGQPIQAAFEEGLRWWGSKPNLPANTVIFVAGFPLLPEVLVAIEATAVVPI
jgi:enamine deaminase RidA (YjgF/YER057c/UK114 family)